jgi:virginiamycin B lyase
MRIEQRGGCVAIALGLALAWSGAGTAAGLDALRRPMAELTPDAVLHLGATADWVAIAPDAVWIGGTGPNALHRIDPKSNRETAVVALPGEPGAGLAVGFGAVWAPLCGDAPGLARVDLKTGVLKVFPVAPAGAEGGIAASADSLWMALDAQGTLGRIDPATGAVRQRVKIAPGSFNPHVRRGVVWVTSIEASLVTAVDARTGAVLGTVPTGPRPRFLTDGAGAIWTLNQGDGSVTRIDAVRRAAAGATALETPGHGGDIAYAAGRVWTTLRKTPLTATDARTGRVVRQWVGEGGDSLGIGFGAIWLTDFSKGDVVRIPLKAALKP